MVEEKGSFPNTECRHELTDNIPLIIRYIHGGRGIITLQNSQNKKYHTYEFRRPNNPDIFDGTVRFVYVLVKDNMWMYVGMYFTDTMYFKLTRNSAFSQESEVVKGVYYLLKRLTRSDIIFCDPMKIYHEGVCCVCGRKLTTPNSIKEGIGPRCKKVLAVLR